MDILAKNLLILASAGSGKTFQLSNRIIGLVAHGAEPGQIVALTFTRKAAAEFADSLLTKLADAAINVGKASQLGNDIGMPSANFRALLASVAGSLHRMTLGTMDSFFSRIVRGFQYELGVTGGRFELIEGAKAEMMAEEILAAILGDVIDSRDGAAFCHAFRRASAGREAQGVGHSLRRFAADWHEIYLCDNGREWGPGQLLRPDPQEWEKQKHAIAAKAIEGADAIDETRNGQRDAYRNMIATLAGHTIGSGSLAKMNSMLESAFAAVAEQPAGGPITLRFYKSFELSEPSASALRDMIALLAACETSAAVTRTRAIRELVAEYDKQWALRLRSQGKLGFNDVKVLMGQWARTEHGRLRRESVDFRLDARIHHWLLDEFQDTSRADWDGLFPLIDEAATDPDRSLFIVGDRKQAIYAWRGGDVSLFDEVEQRYRPGGLKVEPLDESWRSSPEVLALVNRICGDSAAISRLFGSASEHWRCPFHESATPLKRPEKRGHAMVETHTDKDSRFARMVELLTTLGVGQRQMTCGILTRTNDLAQDVADELRSHGFDVIVDGHREPGRDTPLGIAVSQLLAWLANPEDAWARQAVAMSPLGAVFNTDGSWHDAWNALTSGISRNGYQHTIADLLHACHIDWSEFGNRRIQDLLDALGDFDQHGGIPAAQAARLIDQLKVSQSPGTAAVQVMTIHKSKGLGFDVVILPDIPAGKIPHSGYFSVAYGDGWLMDVPPQWARQLVPELRTSEEAWTLAQYHEALCTLYVALTRAKRGLYVLLDHPKTKEHDFSKASLANLILNSTSNPDEPGVLHESGDASWAETLPFLQTSQRTEQTVVALPSAAQPVDRRPLTPSRVANHATHSPSGVQYGREFHQLLETIGWIDESEPTLPATDAGEAVKRLLAQPDCRQCFVRTGMQITLLREQAVDAIVNGRFISGVIDRLHLHRDAAGDITHVDIIDFKTDTVKTPGLLAELYGEQLECYRTCIQQLHPTASIRCLLMSLHHTCLVEI